ncbi:N-acetylmuramoyl-L-alanine amidase family protein [Streptococcus halotolerans]|uniref:peptidoglycan recognition protein family protein n=1 Tax=Streptococcus halotolerans TaxID=1814128 RepID=UPI00078795B9|nr:peptidoglycan recognition family protein [Streptococcus halotolerans]
MQRYQKRHKPSNQNKQKIIALLSLIVIVLTGLTVFQYFKSKEQLHYQTHQLANITHEQKLFDSQFRQASNPFSQQETVTITAYREKRVKGTTHLFAGFTVNGRQYYTLANQLAITQENPINQSVADLGYPKIKGSKQMIKRFAKMPYLNPSRQPKGIIIHETGNDGSTIDDEIHYMKANYQSSGVFVHSFIDASHILMIADPNFMAQGAGPKANPSYIQFEMTRENSSEGFSRQLANAAYYTAKQLHHYHLPLTVAQKDGQGTIWTHDMVSRYLGGTDHTDPVDYWTSMANYYWGVDYTVDDFAQLVQTYYNQL